MTNYSWNTVAGVISVEKNPDYAAKYLASKKFQVWLENHPGMMLSPPKDDLLLYFYSGHPTKIWADLAFDVATDSKRLLENPRLSGKAKLDLLETIASSEAAMRAIQMCPIYKIPSMIGR
jgi:hypothetical protein